ncbi:MAG TPA: tryptophan synthase subunit beta [Lentisphaeria bacterium]|nr:MAG: tryptophan synthase subunit beta [Lentisphaerae bacterium GWF2_50_93]HCE44161.1 tryptophan synthase subunit beta [Lentisphaeria bacterium]
MTRILRISNMDFKEYKLPDNTGHFGQYGGMFVPETLIPALKELEEVYEESRRDPQFMETFKGLMKDYVGRPTPLYFAERLTKYLGGAKIYLKREDLCHTGAHKINNSLGQALLAVRMGKKRVIAETGAGQHGVATATAAARFGLECVVYMGDMDMKRQALNVIRMRLLGTEVRPVHAGQKTLKEAVSAAIRDWVSTSSYSHYILGSALGPHPFPRIVRDFQSCIGREVREQIIRKEKRFPDLLIACVGGGSNSIGLFHPFLADAKVKMLGVEAGGRGSRIGEHAARFAGGRLGILQGTRSYVLQDKDGQIALTHSVSAGLDYAAVGPEHSYLKDSGRVQYTKVSDKEALASFKLLSELEGIIPALESAHAVAGAVKAVPKMKKNQIVVVNISGRGDKDVEQAAKFLLK